MPRALPREAIAAYHRDGILFPIPVLDAAEVDRFRALHERVDRELGGRPIAGQVSDMHLHYRWVSDLATHPRVLDAVEDILGPDLLVHSSTFFVKYAGDRKFLSWHQDANYWGLSESALVSAWIALTDSTAASGCMRVLPGTQREKLKHVERRHADNVLTKGLTVEEAQNEEAAVDVELAAGEMSLHHADIIHGSKPNVSDGSRIGFVVRYIATRVRQEMRHYPVLLARGRDAYGHFELQDPPVAGFEEGLLAHRRFESARGNPLPAATDRTG